jgi:hypothetical protein
MPTRASGPTPAQLRERGERLLYEVLMLSNTAALLDEDVRAHEEWRELTRYMAVVESFLVHTHSLLRFLYPPRRVIDRNKRKPAEVFALDYCGATWRARPWARVGKVRATIRQDMQHLSLARLPVARSEEYGRVVAALKTSLASFVDDAQLLSSRSRSRLRTALEESAGGTRGARGVDAAPPPIPVPAIPVPRRTASV